MLLVYAVNDSHGAPDDIADVVKDINDGMYSLNVDDGDGSLQLSVTQSQSFDGTEPVTQAEDVPMQLQLEDERIRKKKCDFQRRRSWNSVKRLLVCNEVMGMLLKLLKVYVTKVVTRPFQLLMLDLMEVTCL